MMQLKNYEKPIILIIELNEVVFLQTSMEKHDNEELDIDWELE